MATKRVEVSISLLRFSFQACSAHEAAAMALGRIRNLRAQLPSDYSFLVLVDGKYFEVPKKAAEAWISAHGNPKGPVEAIAKERWRKAVES